MNSAKQVLEREAKYIRSSTFSKPVKKPSDNFA